MRIRPENMRTTRTFQMIVSQQNSCADHSASALAQWKVGVDYPADIVCSGPKHQYPTTEDVHLTLRVGPRPRCAGRLRDGGGKEPDGDSLSWDLPLGSPEGIRPDVPCLEPGDGFYDAAPPATSMNDDTLTPREQEILHRLAQGYLAKEIAAPLGTGCDTVRTYMRRTHEKLPVHSRAQAGANYLPAGAPRQTGQASD